MTTSTTKKPAKVVRDDVKDPRTRIGIPNDIRSEEYWLPRLEASKKIADQLKTIRVEREKSHALIVPKVILNQLIRRAEVMNRKAHKALKQIRTRGKQR